MPEGTHVESWSVRSTDALRVHSVIKVIDVDDPFPPLASAPKRVGAPGFEPGTSALSGLRSNQLSYAPLAVPGSLASRRRRSKRICEERVHRTRTPVGTMLPNVMRGRPETVPVADDRLPYPGRPRYPTAPLVPLCASLPR